MRKYFFAALILAFIGYAGYFFADAVTPYVGVAEARASQRNVQVKGLPDTSVAPHMENETFVFSIVDEETGEKMLVRYKGIKPGRTTLSLLGNTPGILLLRINC